MVVASYTEPLLLAITLGYSGKRMGNWLQGLSWQACANLLENSLWPDSVKTHGDDPSCWPQDVQQMKQDFLTKLSSAGASSDNIFSLKLRFDKLEGLRLKGMLTDAEVTHAKYLLIPSTTSNANGVPPANRTGRIASAELPVVRSQPSAPVTPAAAAAITVARAPPARSAPPAATPQTPPMTMPSNRRAAPPSEPPAKRPRGRPRKQKPAAPACLRQVVTCVQWLSSVSCCTLPEASVSFWLPTAVCCRSLDSSLPAHSQVAECQTTRTVASQPSHAAAEPQAARTSNQLPHSQGNVPASRQLLVTHIPLREPHYRTIKAALKEARDGDTINVAPGTYCETMLVVQDAITLQCLPGGRAIVSSIKATSLIIASPDVTIKGMTFKPTQLKGDDVAAVIIRADRTKLDNCTVYAAARHAYTTAKELPPICCLCLDDNPCKDVSILNCKIEAGQACIGVLFNAFSSGIISNSQIHGQDGIIGVQLFAKTEIKLCNNTISNFHDDGITAVTTAKDLVITSNTIKRCKWGICATAEQLVVTRNTITACNEGLVLHSPRRKSHRVLTSVELHEHRIDRNLVQHSRMCGIRVTSPLIRGQFLNNTITGSAQAGLWFTLNEEEAAGVVHVPATVCLSIIGNAFNNNGDVGLVVDEPFRVDAQQCRQANTFSGNKLGNISIADQ
eukprot:jgi/Chlat1/4034/Chrsp26S08845